MGNTQYKVKSPRMFAPPYNSILAWFELLWQLFCAVVGMIVLIDVWNTNAGLLLAILLFGFVLNLLFYLWSLFWDGYRVKQLSEIKDKKPHEHIMYWVLWLGDQPHFFINMVIYAFVLIFFGLWLGTQNGLISYQPLALVPTSQQITNMVIHKFFAFIIVLIAGVNWGFGFRSERFALYEIVKAMKTEPSGEITTSKYGIKY
jgi:hypothetical protein